MVSRVEHPANGPARLGERAFLLSPLTTLALLRHNRDMTTTNPRRAAMVSLWEVFGNASLMPLDDLADPSLGLPPWVTREATLALHRPGSLAAVGKNSDGTLILARVELDEVTIALTTMTGEHEAAVKFGASGDDLDGLVSRPIAGAILAVVEAWTR
jgi:hypothetical protein